MCRLIETNAKAIVAEKVQYVWLRTEKNAFVVAMDNGDRIGFNYDNEEESIVNYEKFIKRLKGEEDGND